MAFPTFAPPPPMASFGPMVATETRMERPAQSAASANDGLDHVTRDIIRLRTQIVNLFFVGEPGASDWVLVDTGMFFNSHRIMRSAERLYGASARPKAIVLTHG